MFRIFLAALLAAMLAATSISQAATNLNSSKSNRAVTVKGSKSNSSERKSGSIVLKKKAGQSGASGIAVSDPGADGPKKSTK